MTKVFSPAATDDSGGGDSSSISDEAKAPTPPPTANGPGAAGKGQTNPAAMIAAMQAIYAHKH